jgi:UDP-N-acetylmuramyl tripeptide synthase
MQGLVHNQRWLEDPSNGEWDTIHAELLRHMEDVQEWIQHNEDEMAAIEEIIALASEEGISISPAC